MKKNKIKSIAALGLGVFNYKKNKLSKDNFSHSLSNKNSINKSSSEEINTNENISNKVLKKK